MNDILQLGEPWNETTANWDSLQNILKIEIDAVSYKSTEDRLQFTRIQVDAEEHLIITRPIDYITFIIAHLLI